MAETLLATIALIVIFMLRSRHVGADALKTGTAPGLAPIHTEGASPMGDAPFHFGPYPTRSTAGGSQVPSSTCGSGQ
jgi:hypothetical protein